MEQAHLQLRLSSWSYLSKLVPWQSEDRVSNRNTKMQLGGLADPGAFLLYCAILSAHAICKVLRDQQLKIKVGAGLAPSDLRLTRSVIFKLVVFAFLGGFMSGALGLAGGTIFNPLLLSLGVLPCVASATGMYMILFS